MKILKFFFIILFTLCLANLSFSRLFYECAFPGKVSLTFDDGPSPAVTREVLDVLKSHNLTSTFFINGFCNQECNETRFKETVKRAFDEGHQIGSHSWSHLDMVNLTLEEVRKELTDVQKLVFDIIGKNMTVFRPPYGEFNQQLIDIAENEYGYDTIIWNVDTNDWRHPDDIDAGFQEWINAITDANYTSFISLQHDWVKTTPVLVEVLIKYIQSYNYTIVPVSECIGGHKYQL